jgi:hypothetical protein
MDKGILFDGYEISPQAFELCQQRSKERLHFNLKDLLLDNGNASFDIILVIDVLEHLEDYFDFLKKLKARSLFKIFHIPLDLSVQTVLRSEPLLRVRSRVGHIHYFTKETALAVLKDAGYQVVDYFYTAGSIDLPAKSMKALLARLPRKILYRLNKDIAVRMLGGYSLMVLTK